jgi:hypothetical protein
LETFFTNTLGPDALTVGDMVVGRQPMFYPSHAWFDRAVHYVLLAPQFTRNYTLTWAVRTLRLSSSEHHV